MEEKIYTIPVNEAVNGQNGCPLCRLKDKIENDFVERALGGAMMEPSERIKTNEKGFCRDHFQKLYARQQILPLSLILDTHIDEIETGFSRKQPFTGQPDIRFLLNHLEKIQDSCYLCERINALFSKYVDTYFLLWKKDEAFQKKCVTGDGYCMEHFLLLLKQSEHYLPKKMRAPFCQALVEYQQGALSILSEKIHWFCQKFNYSNADKPWNGAENAPIQALEKLAGAPFSMDKSPEKTQEKQKK